jgi:hypothetical protein
LNEARSHVWLPMDGDSSYLSCLCRPRDGLTGRVLLPAVSVDGVWLVSFWACGVACPASGGLPKAADVRIMSFEDVAGMVLFAFTVGPLDMVDWLICVEFVVVVLALLDDELPFSVKRISGEIRF